MFLDTYNKYKLKAEENLKKEFGTGGFPRLEKAMEYSLFAGGKRIRPVIFLYLAEKYGVDENQASKFSCAIEMIHTYSLIHDDLPSMDNDTMRRGVPTNHVMFGEGFAVLAGDSLLNLAYETLFDGVTDNKSLIAAKVISANAGRLGMCSGQAADLYFEKNEASEKDVEYINANKTGALIKAAFISPLILSGVSSYEVSIMAEVGVKFGLLFQLTDDLLDKYGNAEKLGKSIGKDEAEDKKNTLSLLGEKETKKQIAEISSIIKEQLNKLPVKLDFLSDLCDYIVKRDS